MPSKLILMATFPEASRLSDVMCAMSRVRKVERKNGTSTAGPTGWLVDANGCDNTPKGPNGACGGSLKLRLPVVTGGGGAGGGAGGDGMGAATLAVFVTVKKLLPKSWICTAMGKRPALA